MDLLTKLRPPTLGLTTFSFMSSLRRARNLGEHLSYEQLLLWAQYYNATDPRDKLFALLGMAPDVEDEAFDPDYMESPESVYTRMTAKIFTKNRSLALLCAAGIGLERNLNSLPTWVPDYSTAPTVAPLGISPAFRASGTSAIQPQCIDRRKLKLTGIIIDTVDKLGSISQYKDSLKDIRMHEEGFHRYPTGIPWGEAVWRTAIADNPFQSFEKAPLVYGQYWNCYTAHFLSSIERLETCGMPDSDCAQLHRSIIVELLSQSGFGVSRSFTTNNGFLGLTWPKTSKGDRICIFIGSRVPFVIRENTSTESREHKI
jgi:hypothetical protein